MKLKQGVTIFLALITNLCGCLFVPHLKVEHQAVTCIALTLIFGFTMFASGWEIGRGPERWED